MYECTCGKANKIRPMTQLQLILAVAKFFAYGNIPIRFRFKEGKLHIGSVSYHTLTHLSTFAHAFDARQPQFTWQCQIPTPPNCSPGFPPTERKFSRAEHNPCNMIIRSAHARQPEEPT